jgi:hypothetical protein
MFGILWDLLTGFPWLAGTAGAALLAFVAVGMLGGWPLVLNRRVIGALLALLGAVALVAAWLARDARLRDDGAHACLVANDNAKVARRDEISHYVLSANLIETSLRNELAAAKARLDSIALDAERNSHVSAKADAACPIPRGFVFDVNAVLPGPGGPSPVPPAPADFERPAAGVALSTVRNVVVANLAKGVYLEQRLDACEEARYKSCLEWDLKFHTESGCAR